MSKNNVYKTEKSDTVSAAWHKKPVFLNLAENLLSKLNARSREIIRKRFGLLTGKNETLEEIGKQYGITRERIRQIIAEAVRNILAKSEDGIFSEAEEKIIFTIESNGGIIKRSDIIEKFDLKDQKEANAIKFFASCSKKILEIEERGIFEKVWVTSKDLIQSVKKVILEAEEIIQKEKRLLADQEIFEKLSLAVPKISKSQAVNFLRISSRVKKNKFEKWGMADWTEVSPKGTREKVYLILKEQKKPLHFTEIAKLIDKFQLGKRKAHPQTVHNELIKDERFVLIGRGTYALREWGYAEGTVREIIRMILGKSGKSLNREEIIEKVLKMRKVKKTTIMINLNNRKFFEKRGESYAIKE